MDHGYAGINRNRKYRDQYQRGDGDDEVKAMYPGIDTPVPQIMIDSILHDKPFADVI
jgi:hypothetical protein